MSFVYIEYPLPIIMPITRRGFLQALGCAGALLALGRSGFADVDFEFLVEGEYQIYKRHFEQLPANLTIARTALYLEEAKAEDYMALEQLTGSMVDAALLQEDPVEKLRKAHIVLESARPYEVTTTVTEAVAGFYSDCDTRSILLMDACQIMGGPNVSIVIVPRHAYLKIEDEANWETTAPNGRRFGDADYLKPVELSLDELTLNIVLNYACAQTSDINGYAKAAALSQFVLEMTKILTARAHYQVGKSFFSAYKELNEQRLLDKAREHLEKAFDVSGEPYYIFCLAETYDSERRKKILYNALFAVSDRIRELLPYVPTKLEGCAKQFNDYTMLQLRIGAKIARIEATEQLRGIWR